MTRIKKIFYILTFILYSGAFLNGPAFADAADAAGKYCWNQTFNRPMTMNLDGTCPPRAIKPEGINECVIVEQQLGELLIEERDDGAIYFEVSMIFPSEYSCELEGIAQPNGDDTWRHTRAPEHDPSQDCVLDITRKDDGRIVFADPTGVCSHSYCGAQAYFYNVGFGPESKGGNCLGGE